MSCEMLLGTQHHTQMVRPPLSGADMGSAGWGSEGTYLSGGGFVRQSQDSHRQYIFEWSGARSIEEASYMQALRDGVYSKSRRDLIYFIDPNIYDKNILPKRWAQPGILAPDSGAAITPLGTVSKVDGPGVSGLPLTGAQVSSYFTSLAMFDSTTTPQQGSIWVPVPPGKTLHVVAWTGNPVNSESGVYVRGQNLDGSWNPASLVEGFGFEGSGLRGVLVGAVGAFDFYAARAVLDLPPSQRPVSYAWTGAPNASTSTRTTDAGTVTNQFTNPDMQATDGEVVVWENRTNSPRQGGWLASRGTFEDSGENRPGASEPAYRFTTTRADGAQLPIQDPSSRTEVNDTDVWRLRGWVKRETSGYSNRVGLYVYRYDAGGAFITTMEVGSRIDFPLGEWVLLDETATFPSGTASIRFGFLFGGISPVGESILVSEPMTFKHLPDEMLTFSETFSPDPDLTPQPRPGGGAQLVGEAVQGIQPTITSGNVRVVQSKQWAKSEEVSARIITVDNKVDPIYPETTWILFAVGVSVEGDAGSLALYRRLERAIGEFPNSEPLYGVNLNDNYLLLGVGDFEAAASDALVNELGEQLVRAHLPALDEEGAQVYLAGGGDIGDSVWIDLVTIADVVDYEGPPFSGDTPDNPPKWSPGLGHSGCAFVGNPTWTATSGVNGGQVGYAATLKEVGDWQQ